MKEQIIKKFDEKYLEKYPDQKFNNHQYWSIRKMVGESVHEGLVEAARIEQANNTHLLNTPLLALMHDTAHDFDDFKHKIDLMSKYNKEMKSDSRYFIIAEYLKSIYENLMSKIDTYYVQEKSNIQK